jgi:hypothetical protein
MNKATVAAIALIVILATVVCVYAVTTIISNPINITPQPTPSPSPSASLTLTSNTTTPRIGESIQLTAILSSHQQGIAITFNLNGTAAYTSGTNSEGIAYYTTAPFGNTNTATYTATCTIP